MFFCIATLMDHSTQNEIRTILSGLYQRTKVGVVASLLPQHISLKSTFQHGNQEEIAEYFDSLAESTPPIRLEVDRFQAIPIREAGSDSGLLWLGIRESPGLREVHHRINSDLQRRFGTPIAGSDGEEFHFHSTLVYGQLPYSSYQAMLSGLAPVSIAPFHARELALFCSHEDQIKAGTFYVLRIQPLEGG